MKYWFDKNSTKKNIVILSTKALIIASADKDSQERVEQQLNANTHPKTVFGSDGFQVILFATIESISSRDTDSDLEISYKTAKTSARESVEDQFLFSDAESKQECLGYIEKLLVRNETNLERTVHQQSIFTAILNPLLSLLLALVAMFMFYSKVPYVALAVGGIWILASVYFLYTRFKKPSMVTRWAQKGKYAKKSWSSLKTAYSYGFVALAITGLYIYLPTNHDPAALYNAIQFHHTDETPIQHFLDKGADINYMAEDGTTPLITALNYNEEDIAVELINKGAILSTQFIGQTPLDVAIESSLDRAVSSMLNKEMVTSNPLDLLMRSISSGLNFNNIQLIADSGMDMNHTDNEGLTALSLALLFEAEPKVVKLLLDRGASTNIKVGGLSPLEFAREQGYTEIIAMLEQYGS